MENAQLYSSAAKEQQQRAAVLQSAADAILMFDADDCLSLINPAGGKLFMDYDTKLGVPLPRGHGYDALIELMDETCALETREVSRDRTQANRFLTNTTILRMLLWATSLIPVAFMAGIYFIFFDLTTSSATALGLLMIGMFPSSIAASLAFLFNAYEKFEYRIAVDFTTRLLAVALGVIALVAGYGYIGLAIVSIITNMLTLAAFYLLVRLSLFKPRFEMNRGLMRWMFFESYPLMINNLLSSLFFRIDVLILQPLKGDAVLGY